MKGRQRKSRRSGSLTLTNSSEVEKKAVREDETPKPLLEISIQNDAAAIARLRRRIDELLPPEEEAPKPWTISKAIHLLWLLKTLLDETTSHSVQQKNGEEEIILFSRASSLLSEFIMTLADLRHGVIDPRFEAQTNISGNSLKILDRNSIALSLQTVNVLRRSKMVTLKQARVAASQTLNDLGIRVATREITPDRLKEWAKDYDLDGAKKEGK